MRVLIFGATGLLGKALLAAWTADSVAGVGSRETDIRDSNAVRELFARHEPDWTVLAAAYTDVDGCERNPDLAQQVNADGAANVAKAAREAGSRLMLLSTDYVFNGMGAAPYEVNDRIAPLSAYGRSKAAAEAVVRKILPEACIVRTSWLFGAEGRCFPNTILDLAQRKSEISVVNDQRGSPTYNRDLAAAILRLTREGATKTIHVTNAGDCTWFELAQELLEVTGITGVTLRPITSEVLARPAPRPKYSVLSPLGLDRYGIRMPSWKDAVRRYVREVSAALPAQTQAASPHN